MVIAIFFGLVATMVAVGAFAGFRPATVQAPRRSAQGERRIYDAAGAKEALLACIAQTQAERGRQPPESRAAALAVGRTDFGGPRLPLFAVGDDDEFHHGIGRRHPGESLDDF